MGATPLQNESVAARLESMGYSLDVCAGIESAIEKVDQARHRGAPFTAVILDVGLGELECQMCCRGLGERSPERMLLLGRPSRHSQAQLHNAGVVAAVPKPVRKVRLEEALAAPEAKLACYPSTPQAPPIAGVLAQPVLDRAAKILVAEDNAVNQRVILKLLERAGYTSRVAINGEEALRYLEQEQFDLILMDCQMPVMDGYETTRVIRQTAGPSSKIPVIALTANAMVGDKERCIEAGMDEHLTKPVQFEALRDTLVRWVAWKETNLERPWQRQSTPAYDGDSALLPPPLPAISG